jgi:hypothetical protein
MSQLIQEGIWIETDARVNVRVKGNDVNYPCDRDSYASNHPCGRNASVIPASTHSCVRRLERDDRYTMTSTSYASVSSMLTIMYRVIQTSLCVCNNRHRNWAVTQRSLWHTTHACHLGCVCTRGFKSRPSYVLVITDAEGLTKHPVYGKHYCLCGKWHTCPRISLYDRKLKGETTHELITLPTV